MRMNQNSTPNATNSSVRWKNSIWLTVGARTSCPPEREARTILTGQPPRCERAARAGGQAARAPPESLIYVSTHYDLLSPCQTPLHSDHDFTIHGFRFTEVR